MPERRYCASGRGCEGCWTNRLKHARRRGGGPKHAWVLSGTAAPPAYTRERVEYIRARMDKVIADELAQADDAPAHARGGARVRATQTRLERPDECAVCMESLRRVGRPLACGHWIHPACMRRAARAMPGSGCPMCRQPTGRRRTPEQVVDAIHRRFTAVMSIYYSCFTDETTDAIDYAAPDDEFCAQLARRLPEATKLARHDLRHVIDWPAVRRKYNL